MAFASVFAFAKALKVGGEYDLPTREDVTIDLTTLEGKAAAAAIKRNSVAVANLTMAFTTDGLMAFIYKSMSDEWPNGAAHEIVKELKNRYHPADTMTRVEMRKQLNKVSMKQKDDPNVLFDKLASIKHQYDTVTKKIEEEDLIAIVLDVAPAQYQQMLTGEQLRLGNSLTLDNLNVARRVT